MDFHLLQFHFALIHNLFTAQLMLSSFLLFEIK